jgi:predicted DNA-binding transcriptional regulator AlpA
MNMTQSSRHICLPPSDLSDEHLLPAKAVCKRYSISSMTLWRWLHHADLGFPQPLNIKSWRYWKIQDLRAWEAKVTDASAANVGEATP